MLPIGGTTHIATVIRVFFLNIELNFLEKNFLTSYILKRIQWVKKRLTEKNTDESSLVDRIIELSDLKLGLLRCASIWKWNR